MDLQGKRIFVIEDDPTNMAIMAYMLKKQGAIVLQDPWNQDTINRLQMIGPVDVILLDLNLRFGVNGYDILDQVNATPELAEIPVLIVSASDADTQLPLARQKGAALLVSQSFLDGFVKNVFRQRRFA